MGQDENQSVDERVWSILEREKKACAQFEENGGDPALFWAGRMSTLVKGLDGSRAVSLAVKFGLLEHYSRFYDTIIMTRTENRMSDD